MNWFLLFTVGPLLLSVKGIIDLAQMPPTILLPHPGGTGTPTLERIAYLPGAQPPFPPRGFNPTSISPGEDPSIPNPSSSLSLTFPATVFLFPHTSLGAALHLPRVLKVSFPRPIKVESCWGMYNCLSVVHNRIIFLFTTGSLKAEVFILLLVFYYRHEFFLYIYTVYMCS